MSGEWSCFDGWNLELGDWARALACRIAVGNSRKASVKLGRFSSFWGVGGVTGKGGGSSLG